MISEGLIELSKELKLTANLSVDEFLATDIGKKADSRKLSSQVWNFTFPSIDIEGKHFVLLLLFYDNYLSMAILENPNNPINIPIPQEKSFDGDSDWIRREKSFEQECLDFLSHRLSGKQPYCRNSIRIESGEDLKSGQYGIVFSYRSAQHYDETGKKIPSCID